MNAATMIRTEKEVVAWLLDEQCPPARYLTLVHLLDQPENHPDVIAARAAIPLWPPVAGLLVAQNPDGYWRHAEDCYWPKWTATTWALIVLAELGMPGDDARIIKGCEHFLLTQQAQDRSFPPKEYPADPMAGYRLLWEPCVTGNMIRALSAFGYGGDPRVLDAAQWLTIHQLPDGGWNCETGEWGKDVHHSSFMSTIEPLWGFASIDKALWSPAVWHSVGGAAEFLLEHFLYRSHNTGRIIDEEWTRLHFPLFYFYDILHGLRVLAELGLTSDGRDLDALDLLISKRWDNGAWALEGDISSLEKRRLVKDEAAEQWRMQDGVEPLPILESLGRVGEPNKFVTIHALRVLKAYGRWTPVKP